MLYTTNPRDSSSDGHALCSQEGILGGRSGVSPPTALKSPGSGGVQGLLADLSPISQQAEAAADNESLQVPKPLRRSTSADAAEGSEASKAGVAEGSGPRSPSLSSLTEDAAGDGERAGLQSLHSEAAGGEGGGLGSAGGSRQMAIDAEAASLQQAGSSKAAQQVRVDEESAALQQPQTLEKVKQARVDEENTQLQTQGRNTSSGGLAQQGNNRAQVGESDAQPPPSEKV